MIAEIQVLPRPIIKTEQCFKHVDAAIAAISASGLKYEVGAMGTTIEGTPDQIWPLLRTVHEATLHSGAEGCMSIMKVSGAADDNGPSVHDLVDKHRP
ncbi:thiamine-binding protein [Demequina sp. B12]|uniref:thiamine-binding protein n=1 Tax=Demequina sp. B12 TaxID=2992757 RepID=UPI00237A8A65|nr:thiamine-binding protein [Demequina sp. B12]MDE0572075.1 thiamine-binding protein [Demequina sp. B12]